MQSTPTADKASAVTSRDIGCFNTVGNLIETGRCGGGDGVVADVEVVVVVSSMASCEDEATGGSAASTAGAAGAGFTRKRTLAAFLVFLVLRAASVTVCFVDFPSTLSLLRFIRSAGCTLLGIRPRTIVEGEEEKKLVGTARRLGRKRTGHRSDSVSY